MPPWLLLRNKTKIIAQRIIVHRKGEELLEMQRFGVNINSVIRE